jgi:hypothetical protein
MGGVAEARAIKGSAAKLDSSETSTRNTYRKLKRTGIFALAPSVKPLFHHHPLGPDRLESLAIRSRNRRQAKHNPPDHLSTAAVALLASTASS